MPYADQGAGVHDARGTSVIFQGNEKKDNVRSKPCIVGKESLRWPVLNVATIDGRGPTCFCLE